MIEDEKYRDIVNQRLPDEPLVINMYDIGLWIDIRYRTRLDVGWLFTRLTIKDTAIECRYWNDPVEFACTHRRLLTDGTETLISLLKSRAPWNVWLDALIEHPQCPHWIAALVPWIEGEGGL